jgi:homoserine O-succinyltransferase
MSAALAEVRPTTGPAPAARSGRPPPLRIGLLNNMPDAGLCATERQFGELLAGAAGGSEIELRLFALASVPRGERALAAMAGRYRPAEAMFEGDLDGLIVTGAEPRAPTLDAEPYWADLTRVIDWTQRAGVASLWSCLAAHAAVLHLDGVRRRPLPTKLSGVFESDVVSGDPLVAGLAEPVVTPHSRQNSLWEDDLTSRGYRVLTHSFDAGVDAFARRGSGLALFLQGHPEYDADTLMREYLRDVGRFLRGERPRHPTTPSDYFGAAIEHALAALTLDSRAHPDPARLALYADALAGARPTQTWRASALQLYRRWLAEVSSLRGKALSFGERAAARRTGARRA